MNGGEYQECGRWFQFSLRTMLLAALVFSLPLSWLAARMARATKQKAAVEEIERLGGIALYDWEVPPIGQSTLPKRPYPPWLRTIVGNDLFESVVVVRFYGGMGVHMPIAWESSPQLDALGLPAQSPVLTDAELRHLRAFGKLDELWLADTEVTDAGLEYLKGLNSLRILNLDNTGITDAGLEHLSGLPNLIELWVGDTKVTDAGLERLKGMNSLESLDLQGTGITDAGLSHLKCLPSLWSLNVSNTKITDAGLEHLRALNNLQWLNLKDTVVTDEGVERLQEALPQCQIDH